MNSRYPNLMSPVKIGNVTAKNRIFSAPTGLMGYTPQGHFTTDNRAYFEFKASGGCAVVSLGECIVHGASGSSHNLQPALDDMTLMPSLTMVAKDIKRRGALANIELSHGGKYGGLVSIGGDVKEGKTAYGPSEEFLPDGQHVHEMPRQMIKMLIKAYGEAALVAKRCGFDMVNVHAAHGWLFSQFLSPLQNHRRDEYGGSLENRARFFLEVLDEVRRMVGPGYPIEVRMNGDDFVEGGMHLDDYISFAKLIQDKVDLINVSCGSHEVENLFVRTHPSMFLEHGCNVYLAAAVKKEVDVPVSCVGALNDPAQMEEILASGKADIIELGRALVADPYLPKKIAENREDEIVPCLRCFECLGHSVESMGIQCAVNPIIGNELDWKSYNPPAESKKVLIAGGGPGGMMAAITAAQRGHEVILCEASDSLGGALKFAQYIDFKRDLYGVSQALAAKLLRTSVRVCMKTEVTPALVEELKPDVVIVAVGAEPVVPPIEGVHGEHVYLASEAEQLDVRRMGESIVVFGGGLVGCETAIHLAKQGKKVTIVEMCSRVAPDCNCFHKTALDMQLNDLVTVLTETRAVEITAEGLLVRDYMENEMQIKADTVILAAGMRSNTVLAEQLQQMDVEVQVIGDAVRPNKVTQAIHDGYYCAKYL